jgi:hypothetical protein
MWLVIPYVSQYFVDHSTLSFGITPRSEGTRVLEEGIGIQGDKEKARIASLGHANGAPNSTLSRPL